MNRRILRQVVTWGALAAVGALAAWLRFGLVEQSRIAGLCGDAGSPWWCAARQALVLGFLHGVYGVAALVVTAWAVFSRRAGVAWAAAALGVVALILYNYETGALALLVGSLRLLRLQADAPPGAEDGYGDGEVEREP